MSSFDVVVIGGGVSGLTSAYRLLKKRPDLNLALLEAKDRLGGRTYSVPLRSSRDGIYDNWDLGGQWVGICQKQVIELLDELNLEIYPYLGHEVTGLSLLMEMRNGSISESTFKKPSLSILQMVEMFLLTAEVDVKSRMLCPYHICDKKLYQEMDAISFQGFLDTRRPAQALYDLLTITCRVMFGAEPCNVSFLHCLSLVKCAGSFETLIFADKNSAQGYIIKNGAQQIAIKLSEIIGDDRIHLSSPVASIHTQGDGVNVVITENGQKYVSKYVIIATPPNMTARLSINPPLPADYAHSLTRLTPGYIIKTVITYSHNFWSDDGYSGEIVTTGNSSRGPISMCFTGNSYDGRHSLIVFCGGQQAIYWSRRTKEERQSSMVAELNRYFGSHIDDYLEYREMDWYREPYIEFSPVCSPCTGGMLYHRSLHEPYNRILFCGSETADEWSGFISGAVQAGTRAATQLLSDHSPCHVTDKDQTDIGNSSTLTQHTCGNNMSCQVKLWLINICWGLVHFLRLFCGRE